MNPGLAMFVLALMVFVVCVVTFAVAEHLATNRDNTRCAPDCPACPGPEGYEDQLGELRYWAVKRGDLIVNGLVQDETGMWVLPDYSYPERPATDFEHDSVQLAADEHAGQPPARRDVAFSLNIPELDNIPTK